MTTEQLSKYDHMHPAMQEVFIKRLVATNDPVFNYTKAAEELMELAELCLKKVNKVTPPPDESVAEEIADVGLRVSVLIHMLKVEDFVDDRQARKLSRLEEYYKEGKYPGRV